MALPKLCARGSSKGGITDFRPALRFQCPGRSTFSLRPADVSASRHWTETWNAQLSDSVTSSTATRMPRSQTPRPACVPRNKPFATGASPLDTDPLGAPRSALQVRVAQAATPNVPRRTRQRAVIEWRYPFCRHGRLIDTDETATQARDVSKPSNLMTWTREYFKTIAKGGGGRERLLQFPHHASRISLVADDRRGAAVLATKTALTLRIGRKTGMLPSPPVFISDAFADRPVLPSGFASRYHDSGDVCSIPSVNGTATKFLRRDR
jgi:hypothetical protein